MALENVITSLVLDVIDHDQNQAVVKAIALDSKTRFVKATLVQHGIDYPVDPNAAVTLTILRPDNVGVQVTGSVVDVDNADRTGTIKGVYAELTQAALAKKGMLLAQFKMTLGEQILRTEVFKINNGVALDAETSTWADQYEGYNLDELVQNLNSAVAEINTLKTGLETVNANIGDMSALQTAANDNLVAAINEAASITTLDATLTQAGVAADAKATGDEISDLKEDLTDLGLSVVNGTINITYEEVSA